MAATMKSELAEQSLNINVGIVGHIDSGKTSLAKILSTTSSTASFDKSPQSQARGITLDLGFSSFTVDFPEELNRNVDGLHFKTLQFTLVDCPGHASLIKTIIGGSQIIDMMLLVIDATKGIQTQTAECLVLGEITTSNMVIAINKIDQFPEDKRESMINKLQKRLQKTLEKTKFADAVIIPVAARPGGLESDIANSLGIKELVEALIKSVYIPQRNPKGPFIFAVDHCFSIRGQGTILTGTVVSGSVTVGDNVEVPSIKEVRKIKSIQMFRRPKDSAMQGDRIGMCVTQFDAKLIERGLVCSPGALSVINAAIISVKPIPYFKGMISTKSKFHISLGHETVMATCSFFGCSSAQDSGYDFFDWKAEYSYQNELSSFEGPNGNGDNVTTPFALLEFERSVPAPLKCLVIGSRLDADIHQNMCRLAFQGVLLHGIEEKDYVETVLPNLKIFKMKQKEGIVERMLDGYSVIAKSLFKKETNMQNFAGMKVKLSTGEDGVIEGSFGQSGKSKIRIPGGLKTSSMSILEKDGKKGKSKSTETSEQITISLIFKRYVFDTKKKMVQS